MNDMVIIALSGPDGTGKSSCAENIVKSLRRRGITAERLWIKNMHTIAYLLIRLQEFINPRRVVRGLSGTFVKNSLAFSRFWPWVEFFGIIPKLAKVEIEFLASRCRKVYVADRFLLDSIVHISIAQGKCRIENSLPLRLIASFLKKYALTFWFDGDERLLMKRKGDKAEPLGYMRLQRLLYFDAVRRFKLPVTYIDTTRKSLNEVYEEVYSCIIQKLPFLRDAHEAIGTGN